MKNNFFSHSFKLGSRDIGPDHPPFIIAEMSGNHNQSLNKALELVDAAADAGAHALKIQTYTADTMTLDLKDGDFFIDDPKSLWKGHSLYELYEKAHTPWEWHKPIFDRCKERGVLAFSTPFDETAVDFLEQLDVPFYKIASFENNHLPLIKKVIATGKPLIISTGMANLETLQDLVSCLKENGGNKAVLLKCTSTYPASPCDTNITTIPHMREMFNIPVGLSDHTRGIGVSVASVAMGAPVIEKHFTIDRNHGGVDADFSLEPDELKALVEESERAWQSLGQVTYKAGTSEAKSFQFKRSIYVSQEIKEGEKFSKDNIRVIRPGFGLAPKNYHNLIGKVAAKPLAKGTAMKWKYVIDEDN